MPPTKRFCEVEGCTNPRFGHGFCNAHYKRWRKTGSPGDAHIRGLKGVCSVENCGRPHRAKGLCHSHLWHLSKTGEYPTKPIKTILKRKITEKCGRPYCDKRGSSQGYCLKHWTRNKLFISYGMTGWDEFDQLWGRAGGKCEICRIDLDIDSPNTHLDHCHENLKARGILCHSCNTFLGHAIDSPNVLKAAIDYLEKRSFFG